MRVVLVSTALREPFSKRFEACAATWSWLERQGFLVLRLVGDEGLAEPKLSEKTLRVPVKDEWQNLGVKLWWGLKWVCDTVANLDGVFKLDDDVEVLDTTRAAEDMDALSKFPFSSLGVGVVHAHVPITYAQPRVPSSSPWSKVPVEFDNSFAYASGSFLFLSAASAKRLATLPVLVQMGQIPLEDVLVGKLMAEARVPLTVVSSPAFRWSHLDTTIGCSLPPAQ